MIDAYMQWLLQPVGPYWLPPMLRGLTLTLTLLALYNRSPKPHVLKWVYRVALLKLTLLYGLTILYSAGHTAPPMVWRTGSTLISVNILLALMALPAFPDKDVKK